MSKTKPSGLSWKWIEKVHTEQGVQDDPFVHVLLSRNGFRVYVRKKGFDKPLRVFSTGKVRHTAELVTGMVKISFRDQNTAIVHTGSSAYRANLVKALPEVEFVQLVSRRRTTILY